jgi:transposase, IS5 family
MLRTRAVEVSLWEAVLPDEVLRLPDELARVDALLDDPVFFAPFAPFFDPRVGRPSTPMEVYLRLMFLKFRYRLGYESLCREVGDSITWRRFCRIPLDGRVPHPTTLMKLTTRCGTAAVDGCNEALLAKAAQAKLRTTRLRADTTVVPADVAYPTDSGLLAKAVRRIAAAGRRVQAAGGATRTRVRVAAGRRVPGRGRSGRSCGYARRRVATRPKRWSAASPVSWPGWPSAPNLSYEDIRRGMSRGSNHGAQEATRDTGREQKAQVGHQKAPAITRSTGLRRRERRFESCRGHHV